MVWYLTKIKACKGKKTWPWPIPKYSLNRKLNQLNRFRFIFLFTLFLIIISSSLHYVIAGINSYDIKLFYGDIQSTNLFFSVLITVFIAPIAETFIYQYLAYKLLIRLEYFKRNQVLIILSSAFVFGLMHFYSIFYIVYAFIIGIILMYAYSVRISSSSHIFWEISLSHSILNLFILFMDQLWLDYNYLIKSI